MNSAQKPKRNISITTLLATAVGGLVALSVSVILGISLYTNFTNTTELLEQSSNQLIKRIEQYVKSQIDPARNVVEHIAEQAANGTLDLSDKSELVPTLRASLAAAPELTDVVYWRPDGYEIQVRRQANGKLTVITASIDDNKDLMQFLSDIKNAKAPVWTGPLRFDGVSFVSVSAPVFRDKRYLGTASAGISVANLSFAMQEVVQGTRFTAFVLYDDDFVLAHKNLPELSKAKLSQNTPLQRLEDIGDPVLALYASGRKGRVLESDNFDVRVVLVDGIRHVIISQDVLLYGLKKWRVGIHVPQSAVATQIKRIMASLLAGIALLLVSILAAVLLARKVAKPIKTLSETAMRVGKLELSEISQLPQSRITEINNQSQAFNQMLEGLKWFEAYVPRKLVKSLMKQQDDNAAVSRQKNLTVMFTDLIGFTKMSENLAPSETANMLNKHFALLNSCIEKTDGTLDKYIGDAVMAFWGAPEDQDDHALRACEAAVCIAESMENDTSGVRMKVALHCGPLIVGNIGAPGRMNYTVIGDTVNTSSRIEKLAGDLDDGSKVIILLSEQVAERVKGRFKLTPAGEFSVKGRKKTVKVFRLKERL